MITQLPLERIGVAPPPWSRQTFWTPLDDNEGVGVRRVSRPGTVGDTWQSVASDVPPALRPNRWKFLAWTALPAPLLAGLYPDQAFFKAIIAVAIACSQCAFSLATAEYNIARAVEAVSLKARTAAIADRLANQGMKSGSILPFTSAVVGLSAAACAAIVEVNQFAAAFFPASGALIAAAAAVSKARAELDAQAAAKAVMALGFDPLSVDAKNRGDGPFY